MCGRFTLRSSVDALTDHFQVDIPVLAPRYNIAPTQWIGAILHSKEQSQKPTERQFRLLRWGLVPFWAKDPKMAARMINARSQTVAEKPAFRAAFRYRRCLIPADGFYEWRSQQGQKQPFYFHLNDHHIFAFAGLWESWQNPDGSPLETCTILTTEANALMATVHDRMPVILPPTAYSQWLDPHQTTAAQLQPLLQSYPAEQMGMYAVSPRVNHAKTDTPECIEPLGTP